MLSEDRRVGIDALGELLFAGAAFRTAVAEHFGTGLRELEAISHLDSRGPMTAGELARVLYLTPGSVTNLLDRLESAGLAVRGPHPEDQRRVIIVLTERARLMASDVRSWLALCLRLVPDAERAVDTFAVVGYGLRSIREELRDGRSESLRADVEAGGERREAEALQAALDRAGLVLRLTRTLAQERDEAAIAATVSMQLRAHFGARFVGIALVDEGRATMRYVSLDPLPDDIREQFTSFSMGDAYPVTAAAMQGRAYFHSSVAAAEAEFPGIGSHMAAAKVASMVHLPLVAGADVIGTLAVAWTRARDVDIDDQGLLTVVSGHAAQALRRP